MAVTAMQTKAEAAIAEHFEATLPGLPGGDVTRALRRQAFDGFVAAGLPHRRIEAWKYTDLRTALKVAHPPATADGRTVTPAVLDALLGAELAKLPCIRLLLVSGVFIQAFTPEGTGLGEAWHFGSLAATLGQPGYEWMQPCFASTEASKGDPLLALNTAFAADGIILRVKAGASVELPVHIVSLTDLAEPRAIATRNLIRLDEGASATIIESHVAAGATPQQANCVAQLSVHAGAACTHIVHLAASAEAAHLSRIEVEIGGAASYRCFQLTAGAGLARNETHVRFTGPDARLDISGVMLGRGRDHIDTTLVIDHSTTGCESRELFKAVLDGQAQAVFQGKVIVQPEAQKTDGKQMAKALMLSEDCEFDSKPELEIYADDVACGHGSTVSEIDPAMLFYLRSRGIPEDEARTMLIESFVGEAMEKIEDGAVREALTAVARGWLGRS